MEWVEQISNYCLKQYEAYLPVWTWSMPTGKKTGYSYDQLANLLKRGQYGIVVVAVMMALSFDYSRELFSKNVLKEGFFLVVMELIAYIILGYVLGLKRLPVGYIPLIIMKCFVVIEKQYQSQVYDYELQVIEESSQGYWTTFTYEQKPAQTPNQVHFRNALLISLVLGGVWALTKYTKIDMSNHERTALIATTVCTSTAALLLVSTFAFEAFPEFREVHKRQCEVWVLGAVTTLLFMAVFLFQRTYKVVNGLDKNNMKIQWESAIFVMALYIMMRYIPVIHKGLSAKKLLEHKTTRLGEAVTPEPIQTLYKAAAVYLMKIGKEMANSFSSYSASLGGNDEL